MSQYCSLSHEGSKLHNEDKVICEIISTHHSQYHFFGIYDGHGGSLTANYLASHLHTILRDCLIAEPHPAVALKIALASIQSKLHKFPKLIHKSGACALVCLLDSSKAWVANIGDSRLLAIEKSGRMAQITTDHKPENQEQRRRIQNLGGRVCRNPSMEMMYSESRFHKPFRVYPGRLSVSRTVGDVQIKRMSDPQIISSQPDIFTLELGKYVTLLLFSDGIYQKLSNFQIGGYFMEGKPQVAMQNLFQEALQRGSQDNRTLIAVQLD